MVSSCDFFGTYRICAQKLPSIIHGKVHVSIGTRELSIGINLYLHLFCVYDQRRARMGILRQCDNH